MSVSRILEYMHEAWNRQTTARIPELFHPQATIHSAITTEVGPLGMERVIRHWLTVFPDINVSLLHSMCQGDTIITHWQAQGTHSAECMGFRPTGRLITYRGVSIYRMVDGQVVEYWAYVDTAGMLDQLKQGLATASASI